jgi:uncharacterized NAD(P)/FAD-binding protein YdhS
MKRIGIIGGGFSGTLAAVQLIEQSVEPLEIILSNEKRSFNRGIAYGSYNDKHILNVISSKMSAFPAKPDHFLDWVMGREEFREQDRAIISHSFLSRNLYGEYLAELWKEALKLAASKMILVTVVHDRVVKMEPGEDTAVLRFKTNQPCTVDACVLATGNLLPRNPNIPNTVFYSSPNYFRNPWEAKVIKGLRADLPVLIIGNGLTMVDTVIGLLESGFEGNICSISPHGFNILPHKHIGIKYSKLSAEVKTGASLLELVRLVNKHRKDLQKLGFSAEPVIDALRPYTQALWRGFTEQERGLFTIRLLHLWTVTRHRIPLHIHEKIRNLQKTDRIQTIAGRILNLSEFNHHVVVDYLDKESKEAKKISVSRVINCTGPQTNLFTLENEFLNECAVSGVVMQDALHLGIAANPSTFRVLDGEGREHPRLYTLGSNLKGELWESTAVGELRVQAEILANLLLS